MRTMIGIGGVAAGLMMMATAYAGNPELPDGYTDGSSAVNAESKSNEVSPTTVTTKVDDAKGTVEELGAASSEPAHMKAHQAQDESARARAEQIRHDEWVNSIWTGP